ncbi:MAG: recombination regulator RecX [Alistipes senegalensis]|nr:recombination regulator RecX [Oxalobacter formigenes]MCM1280249.1 recombination regulator RecX [Alistipes senegalensis]
MKPVLSLKARALRYLAARDYSRQELAGRLLRFAQEEDDLNALLDWLEAQGFLSDERFVHSFVRRRMERYGNSRIRQELRRYQVGDDLLGEAMQALGLDEADRAYQVWEKKFGRLPADAKERAKQMRFLGQRGFSAETIGKVMARAKG